MASDTPLKYLAHFTVMRGPYEETKAQFKDLLNARGFRSYGMCFWTNNRSEIRTLWPESIRVLNKKERANLAGTLSLESSDPKEFVEFYALVKGEMKGLEFSAVRPLGFHMHSLKCERSLKDVKTCGCYCKGKSHGTRRHEQEAINQFLGVEPNE